MTTTVHLRSSLEVRRSLGAGPIGPLGAVGRLVGRRTGRRTDRSRSACGNSTSGREGKYPLNITMRGEGRNTSSTDGALVEDWGRGGEPGGKPGGKQRSLARLVLDAPCGGLPTSAAVHEAQRSDGWIERAMACAKVSVCLWTVSGGGTRR
jgi:hypothetical protein